MIIGTAGHIDHGKTSLVRALTGVDTDRLKEEKARGISIELGFAYMPAPDGSVLGFVDVPGHEKFIHHMLAGATGIDFVVLVIAADDGVMPQTREHLAIVDLLGISRGVVALTKSDLIDDGWSEEVTAEIRQLLEGTGLSGSDIIPVSAITGLGTDTLRSRLFDEARLAKARSDAERFRLAVDRSFTLPGAGTVVTGTVLSGAVAVDDRVLISPSGLEARVRSIHAQNRPAERGRAGQRCALNLVGDGITKDSIARGQIVLDPALHAPADRIDATLRLLPTEQKPATQWVPVRLHHASTEVGARLVLLGDEPIAPGTEEKIQLVLDKPIAAAVGDRFVLRDTTAQRTLGGGTFLDLRAPARKRRTPERRAQLDALDTLNPQQALANVLSVAPHFIDLKAFARDRALTDAQIASHADALGLIKVVSGERTFALAAPVWLAFKTRLLETLKNFHAANADQPGIGVEKLRMQLEPRLPTPAFMAVLQSLVKTREIGLDGAWVRLAGHEVRLTPSDESAWKQIAPLISGAERFRPPRTRDIANAKGLREADVRRLLKLLSRMGKVDEVANDHFFLRTTVAEMVDILVRLDADGQFSAAQFRDQVDNGRKVAIQILEFFDRHGVTMRRGDLRRINKHRLDLFRQHGQNAGEQSKTSEQTGISSGREASPVGRPDFKSGRGREPVLGGFDSHSLPPKHNGTATR